ncbi:LolA-related protein [Acetobacter fallax]|uniref:Outer membrane lipoprotein carrier protein LolA n=1 Tax=Acetobacter fallax TaxID=1737473 RepID=A0ABX0KCB8_9PROT|nr:LolA-related protein [Acetobacter fallax]NHO34087.1 outer membrane lipoprotein carrier protein LolA [Acetobacter fallax]NHO37613.1 outer membrane lipoprotein carrier protein LolA [Acetobacter fallax]
MKPSARLVCALLVLSGIPAFPSLTDTAFAQADLPASSTLADTIISRIGAVHARENRFHEVRILAALTKPLESGGTLKWHAPNYLEKLTKAPRREDLVISGESVTVTRGTAQPQTLDAARNPELQLLADTLRAPLSGDITLLRRYYHISAAGNEGSNWTLTLAPATADVAKLLKKVVITGTNNAITRLEILQANGDSQTITISL